MFNRPFSATSHNCIDERIQTSNPTNMLGQEVLVSQELHHKIFDTLTTSIIGQPQTHQNFSNNGITFTFSSHQPQSRNQNFHQNPPQWQWGQPTNLNWPPNPIQQTDPFQYQNFMKNEPYHLKFHLDHQTSTSDLQQESCTPDFANISGFLKRFPPIDRNYRRLILKNPEVKKPDANINLETCEYGKNVTFKDQKEQTKNEDEKKDVKTQASCDFKENQEEKKTEEQNGKDLSCDKVKKQKRSKRRKRRESYDSNETSETDTDELGDEKFKSPPKS